MATEQLTVSQAAARFGVSADTVRRRIKAGVLSAYRDNHGQWWVRLDPDAPPPLAPAPAASHIASLPQALGMAELAAGLVAELRRRAEAAEATATVATRRAEGAEAAAADARQREAEATRRAEVAEGETRGLRETVRVVEAAIADARRRAEEAERNAAELAQRLAALTPAQPPPAPPRRRGWLRRLLA